MTPRINQTIVLPGDVLAVIIRRPIPVSDTRNLGWYVQVRESDGEQSFWHLSPNGRVRRRDGETLREEFDRR